MLSSSAAFAQTEAGKFFLQPKVGVNLSKFTNLEERGYDDLKMRLGLVAGLELGYQVSDDFALTAGLLYSQQGSKGSTVLLGGRGYVHVTKKADYINIPILANCYIFKGFAIKAGIQPAFNVNSSEYNTYDYYEPSTGDYDGKSFDLSIPVGVSYEYYNVIIDARYNWGLTNAIKYGSNKNSVLQITLGYKFNL